MVRPIQVFRIPSASLSSMCLSSLPIIQEIVFYKTECCPFHYLSSEQVCELLTDFLTCPGSTIVDSSQGGELIPLNCQALQSLKSSPLAFLLTLEDGVLSSVYSKCHSYDTDNWH